MLNVKEVVFLGYELWSYIASPLGDAHRPLNILKEAKNMVSALGWGIEDGMK